MSLPLDTFRDKIAYHPWHFWQMANEADVPITSNCNTIVHEYGWQTQQASGREDIRRATKVAEDRLTQYLGYPPLQKFFNETIDLTCRVGTALNGYRAMHQYFPFTIRTGNGKLKQIATETWNFVSEESLSFSKAYGTNLEDTFTLTIADTDTTDLSDYRVYFIDADRYAIDASELERWRVEPVKITRLNAATIQVQGRKWLIVDPVKYQGWGSPPGYNYGQFGVNSAGALDPTDATTFVTKLAVYKRTLSAQNVGKLITDNAGNIASTDISVTIMDAEAGVLQVASSSGANCPCQCFPWLPYTTYRYTNYPPIIQRLNVGYEAGETIENWEAVFYRLALAELQPRICACEAANYEIRQWQRDLSYRGSATEVFDVDRADLGNPIGNKAGQMYAWKQIKNGRRLVGKYLG